MGSNTSSAAENNTIKIEATAMPEHNPSSIDKKPANELKG